MKGKLLLLVNVLLTFCACVVALYKGAIKGYLIWIAGVSYFILPVLVAIIEFLIINMKFGCTEDSLIRLKSGIKTVASKCVVFTAFGIVIWLVQGSSKYFTDIDKNFMYNVVANYQQELQHLSDENTAVEAVMNAAGDSYEVQELVTAILLTSGRANTYAIGKYEGNRILLKVAYDRYLNGENSLDKDIIYQMINERGIVSLVQITTRYISIALMVLCVVKVIIYWLYRKDLSKT